MYTSKYCDITGTYERYGNYVINPGEEIFLYITDQAIPGIEQNRYSISNKLRVFDYKENKFVNIEEQLYLGVSLYNQMKHKYVNYSLHRIYMLVFCYIEGCEELEVNHIDGNKHNCHPTNLEWMTHKENMNHAFENNLINQKLTDFDNMGIITKYNMGYAVRDIAKDYGISSGYVMDLVRGETKKKQNTRRNNIKENFVPVTREKFTPKLSEEKLAEAAKRYSDGEEYFELAKEYGIDRSSFTKQIKKYAETHPEIIIRPLKKFTSEMAEIACKIFEENKGKKMCDLTNLCLSELGLENTEGNRKAIRNLYHGKTYTYVTSKYNYR